MKELSEEQKQMIILSEDFQRFVLKTAKIMERALYEQVDIYTDYIGGGESEEGLWVKHHLNSSILVNLNSLS